MEVANEISGTNIDTPCLLVDLDRLERNIAAMAERAATGGVALRPHFKTHKSVEIARLQMAAGAVGMTVSKLDEAEVLIAAGIDDVLVVTQVTTPAKVARALRLGRDARLVLAVDSVAGARIISEEAVAAGKTVEVSIEVDSGLARCGVAPVQAGDLAEEVSSMPGLSLAGIFTHGGHAYGAQSASELAAISRSEIDAIVEADRGIDGIRDSDWAVSIGSTPGVMVRAEFPGVSEIRPGNYVFFDGIQVSLGVVSVDDCALTMLATVMSRPTPTRAVIDAGSKSLGLDKGAHGANAIKGYGTLLGERGLLVKLSEEHGIMEIPADSPLRVGDRVRILPNHACSTANLHERYLGVRAGAIEREITIDAGRGIH